MSTLVTYHNDPAFKAAFLAELDKHAALDAFVKGTYVDERNGHFRGCGVGCSLASLNRLAGEDISLNTDQHARYPTELGWPLWLAYLEDQLFEHLPEYRSKAWPIRLSQAVPVGVTIGDVTLAEILRWSLADETYGVRHATDDPNVRAVVDRMAGLFDRVIAGEVPGLHEWYDAARAAEATWDAWVARDVVSVWASRDDWRHAWGAWNAWGAWAVSAERRDGFYPALSEYVIARVAEIGRR